MATISERLRISVPIIQKESGGLCLPKEPWPDLKRRLLGMEDFSPFVKRSLKFIEKLPASCSDQDRISLLVHACLFAPEFTGSNKRKAKTRKKSCIEGQSGIASILGMEERDVVSYIQRRADHLDDAITQLAPKERKEK